jgi:hypothetical protein
MEFGNLELLFIVALVVVAVFFFTRCSMKCRCKSSNGGTDTYKYKSYDDMGDMDDEEMGEDAAYSLPYVDGEITPGAWSLPFGGGKVIGEHTYADTGIGTF